MIIRLTSIICATLMMAGCTTTHRTAQYNSYYRPPVSARTQMLAIDNVTPARPGSGAVFHTVKPGDTLWSISRIYNVDVKAIASENSIPDVGSIEKGQVIRIPSASAGSPEGAARPATATARKSRFIWPVRGTLASRFGDKVDKAINKGIDIRSFEGADVMASREGQVVYCDSCLKGFGQTVIIDHPDGFQTVYSYNSEILVKVGDEVRQRDRIARVGQTGRAREPMLHFEIRSNGEPVNPEKYLVK